MKCKAMASDDSHGILSAASWIAETAGAYPDEITEIGGIIEFSIKCDRYPLDLFPFDEEEVGGLHYEIIKTEMEEDEAWYEEVIYYSSEPVAGHGHVIEGHYRRKVEPGATCSAEFCGTLVRTEADTHEAAAAAGLARHGSRALEALLPEAIHYIEAVSRHVRFHGLEARKVEDVASKVGAFLRDLTVGRVQNRTAPPA